MPIILIPIVLFALFMVERWLFGKYWEQGLSADLRFVNEAVTEGEDTKLSEVITNRNFLPLHVLQVNFQTDTGLDFGDETNVSVSDRVNVTDVFSLRFYERITRELPVQCAKRGYYSILKTSLRASDLFSPDIRYTTRDQYTDLYVYPGRLPADKVEVPYKQLMGEVASRRFIYEDNFTFRGIRDYAPTDVMSSINWKATARTGQLKVNLHDFTSSPEVVFVLNVEEPGILFETELLEDCIRCALTLAEGLVAQNVPVALLTNGKDKVTGENIKLSSGASKDHLRSFMRALARIDLKGQRAGKLSEILEGELKNGNGRQIVYCYISTSKSDDSLRCTELLVDEQGELLWICPLTRSMDVDRPEDGRIDFRVMVHE